MSECKCAIPLRDCIYSLGCRMVARLREARESDGEIERLRAEINRLNSCLRYEQHRAAFEREARMRWQPIETAPKDDSYLLVSNGHGVWVARFKSVYQSGWKPPSPWQSMMLNHDHIPSAKRNGSPTHWMPLPTPPSAALHGTMEGDMRNGPVVIRLRGEVKP